MKVKRKLMMSILMIITLVCYKTEGRDPVLHRVGGGKFTWKPEVNFTKWASHEHFYTGDWLYFGFDKHIYNVLEVNKTNYEKCSDTCFVNNITRGGRDVFQLLEERSYYFLSGRGFCFRGMKVEIIVELPPILSLSSPIPLKACSSRTISLTKFVVVFAISLALTLAQD